MEFSLFFESQPVQIAITVINWLLVALSVGVVWSRRLDIVLFAISLPFYFKLYVTNTWFIISCIVISIFYVPFIYLFSHEDFLGFYIFFVSIYVCAIAKASAELVLYGDYYYRHVSRSMHRP